MQIYFDMDGTLCEWNTKSTIEDLYSKGYFISLSPQMEIVNAARKLMQNGMDVFVLGCYLSDSKYALEEKNDWLDKYMPFIKEGNRLFIPYGRSKAQYIQGRCKIGPDCILVDDYSVNLHEWALAGGVGIKVLNGINGTKGTWRGLWIKKESAEETLLRLISPAA